MNRLTLRLSLAITALVTSLLGVGLYLLSEHHYSRMVESRRDAAELQNRMLETALRHQMLEKHAKSELIASILREVGSQPEVQNVMILDHNGVVRQSSHPELVGQHFSRDSAPCMVCHQKAPSERDRWAVLDVPGGEVLRSVQPIENRPECHQCHAPEKRMNGILILDVSLTGLQAQLSADRWWMVVATAMLGFLLLASIGLIMRRLILARLGTLGETARSIAAGDLTQRAAVSGDDTISGLATDFNDMANAVMALLSDVKAREMQLANVMNSVDDGLVVLDQHFRIVAANHAFARRFASHPEALHGHRCQEECRGMRHCEVSTAACPSVRCLTSGEVQRATFQLPAQNGDPGRVEEVHASPVFDQDGKVFQVVEIWRDITERVMEETRLAEIDRLESLGALASGFSHEVNTPLATTLTCAEAILGRIDEAGAPAELREIRDIADTIRGQVLRCSKITEQFRRFSRGIPPSTEPVDLKAVVASVVPLVAPTARQAAVTIRIDDGERVPLVLANTEAVQHVVLNLLVNAIQAIDSGGGTVIVSYHVGADVRLRIRDPGCGIAAEARTHLFEPFRTSRPQGTGLGLFHSRGIMRRFGGDVRLAESALGAGSCFEVVFARAPSGGGMTETRKPVRVVLVDDDDDFRRVMSGELARRGYAVSAVACGAAAIAQAADADVMVLDLRLPDMDGIDVLKKLRSAEVPAGVLVLTGHGTIDTAIQAVRLGAYDYLEKPCPLDRMVMAIQKAYEHVRLVERQRVLEDGYSAPDIGLELIGTSPALEKVRQTIARVAPTDSTTLVLGETGVGKEMVAKSLHTQSRRRDRPFVIVDCAALQEQLLQSELFGHEKGAFTDAARLKHGLFEVGNTGTIFLDEVGEMSPEVQAKLLRVLETGRFRRLGGTKEIAVDVRVISATNRDLRTAITRGHFREDLFFRLAFLTVTVPPLRERREDIRTLVEHFTAQFNARFSMSKRFGPAAMAALAEYRWPGNVRELIHAVQQSIVLTDREVIEPEDLPTAITLGGTDSTPAAGETLPLREMQRRYVRSVMERVGGNRAQAARLLRISERNLYRLLQRYARQASPAEGSDGGGAA